MTRRLLAALLAAAMTATAGPPVPAWAQKKKPDDAKDNKDPASDEYRLHMENGVKLYQDRNYSAAIVEFEAAYKAKPKASPLVNISLCHKSTFAYTKAIAALETALAKHADTMSDSDKKAAADAIAEMRGLLAHVTIEVTPKDAIVSVDGEDQPPAAIAQPLALNPGEREIAARAEGYTPDKRSIRVASGDKGQVVTFALQPAKGRVVVRAHDPQTAIAIDGKPRGFGSWDGYLDPGTYVVQIYRPGPPKTVIRYAAEFDIEPGGQLVEIGPDSGGRPLPIADSTVPPPPTTTPPKPKKRGLYILATGAIVGPLWHPQHFKDPEGETGGVIGGRVAYRVNNAAAFEAMVEYGNVTVESTIDDQSNYSLSSLRIGPNLRLMTPGDTFRVLGILGGGATYDDLSYDARTTGENAVCNSSCVDTAGLDPFVYAEAGVELDFGNVLLGAGFSGYFQATKDLDDTAYGNDPLVSIGGRVHIGYAFW